MRRIGALVAVSVIVATTAASALAAVDEVTPSTNDANRSLGWAHVDVVASEAGSVTLEFVNTNLRLACFEYRADGDASHQIGADHFNPAITDGLYPYVCLWNDSAQRVLGAEAYVEARMVFGDEPAERFDWTRFDVGLVPGPAPDAEPLPDPASDPIDKDACKDGGWQAFGFRNQGQCVRFVETGKDSR